MTAPRSLAILASALLAAFAAPAHATENGQLRALLGAPSFELVTPQFPGLYGQLWYQHYNADKVRDDNGDQVSRTGPGGVPIKVKANVRADVVVPRLTYVTEQIVADGRLGFGAALPIVSLRNHVGLSSGVPALAPALAAQSSSLSGEKTGLGDMEVSGFVDWQQDESRFIAGLALGVPTGDYEAGRAANPGAGNFWTVRPLIVASRVFENGLEFGTRAAYSFNTTNRDTDVRSGQYLHADWAAMYRVTDMWRAGLQGYVVKQTTNDRGATVAADGNKAQVFAAGPMVAYTSESGTWAVDFKVMQEFEVRNRTEGQIGWLRLNVRLD
ncbi:transporter [Rhizobacter sp. Root1221]|uniref:SphA family protein n=1 Tax=Rhizobacter sp. Root1221 TaxID=1736433 RepID=UPI0007018B8E|nr:transporter [Rhizobacter sp. Root1221]KQV95820.1 hypothetical protein ASC87_04555 [Rhizobacter sp. Root1221]